jgi:hypothetical protein
VVVDNTGKICHIQSGFLGHQNDAQQFRLMPQIGHNQELDFPQNVVLLADKIYPNPRKPDCIWQISPVLSTTT